MDFNRDLTRGIDAKSFVKNLKLVRQLTSQNFLNVLNFSLNMPALYYIDSCIWLNLFKKEVSKQGKLFWKITENFLKDVETNQSQIIVSTIVLKEIQFALPNEFKKILEFFEQRHYIQLIKTINEDYIQARKWEPQTAISFYDCLHAAIAKRTKAILISRDAGLLEFAKKHITAVKPEESLFIQY